MAKNQWAKKVDANQPGIVEEGRLRGYTVTLTHRLGGGFPDILVTHELSVIALLVEIKIPSVFKSKGQGLTTAEQTFKASYPGPYIIAMSWEQIENKFIELHNQERSYMIGSEC